MQDDSQNIDVISVDEINKYVQGTPDVVIFIRYFNKLPSEMSREYYFKKTGEDKIKMFTKIQNKETPVFTFSNVNLHAQVQTYNNRFKISRTMRVEKLLQWIAIALILIIIIIQLARL